MARYAAALLALVVAASASQVALAQQALPAAAAAFEPEVERWIDPAADRLLRQMFDYLGSLPAFTVEAKNTEEIILVNGQKLDFEASSHVTVQRPNRLRSRRIGVLDEVDFYYDGAAITLRVKDGDVDYYATAPMPNDLDGALDAIRGSLSLEIPGADFLYSDGYAGMTWDLTAARYVGLESLGSVRAHHLAFRTPSIDFQLWVGDGDRPLPHKYIITTKWTTGAPQFGVEFSNWNVSPQTDEAAFTFTPPPGARQIEFVAMPASDAIR
jgi:hypothetical protein